MRIDVLTLFPDVFTELFRTSIIGRAVAADLVDIELTNYRDFTHDRHRSVEDDDHARPHRSVKMR